MTPTIAHLFGVAFLFGTTGLLALVIAITRGQFRHLEKGALVPFAKGERGWTEEPIGSDDLRGATDGARSPLRIIAPGLP